MADIEFTTETKTYYDVEYIQKNGRVVNATMDRTAYLWNVANGVIFTRVKEYTKTVRVPILD
jgi:hypothetical protein